MRTNTQEYRVTPIGEIALHPRNPRKGDVEAIAESVEENGFYGAVYVQRSTGFIVAGNHRYQAAVSAGATELPVIWIDIDDERALRIVLGDNRTSDLAENDDAQVAALLRELGETAAGLKGTGYDETDLDRLLKDLLPVLPAGTQPQLPPPPPRPVPRLLAKRYKIHTGDVLEVLARLKPNTIDAVLTDPPYGIDFIGSAWDRGVPSKEVWAQVMRVCKPGAPVFAFGSPRTFHRQAVAMEDAGLEIGDTFAWIHANGMTWGSRDISKELDEAAGVEREMLGKIDGARYGKTSGSLYTKGKNDGAAYNKILSVPVTDEAIAWQGYGTLLKPAWEPCTLARKPLEGTTVENVKKWGVGGYWIDPARLEPSATGERRWPPNIGVDEAVAEQMDRSEAISRYMFVAKASRAEREQGCDHLPPDPDRGLRNSHPTLKPIDLTRQLATLLLPPQPGTLLVPYSGAGSEMIGALLAGWPHVIGIELAPKHVEIAHARIRSHLTPT